jgi:N-carbamoylputrescine amidase
MKGRQEVSVLQVALLQLLSSGADQDANLAKGGAACRRARELGADIALFPEMWNIGYTAYPGCPKDFDQIGAETAEQLEARASWQAQAIERDAPFVRHFQSLARELGLAVAVTYLERWPGAPRNSVSLIDRHGEMLFTYAKVHTCDFGLEAACTPGDAFHAAPLDTAHGEVRVGAMICYDRQLPESARILMLQGAELILTPNSCELEQNRLTQFRARAFENMVGVAMANYAAPQQNGHSVAYDGRAFEQDERSRDMLIFEAGELEGVYLAGFDLPALRAYRQRETWGNAFRRPQRYGLMTSPAVEPPFVRVDAAGKPYDRGSR